MSAVLKLHCHEKVIFLDAYEQAASAFSAELTKLRARMGVLSHEAYDDAYHRVEELRLTARAAQDQLMRHVITHGC